MTLQSILKGCATSNTKSYIMLANKANWTEDFPLNLQRSVIFFLIYTVSDKGKASMYDILHTLFLSRHNPFTTKVEEKLCSSKDIMLLIPLTNWALHELEIIISKNNLSKIAINPLDKSKDLDRFSIIFYSITLFHHIL